MKSLLRHIAAAFAALAAVSASAATLYWNGGSTGSWDSSSQNWKDVSGNATAWIADSTASFANSSAMTITVVGSISADNILGTGSGQISFNGNGTLAWKGWLQCGGQVNFANTLTLADNGNGLHFNNGGHVFLNTPANTHTGGNYIKANTTADCAFSLDGGDGSLGPVPAAPTDNIFAKGTSAKNASLFVSNKKDITIHANRRTLVSDGCELRLCPQGTLRINGVIRGENNSSTKAPTGTRVHAYTRSGWTGRTVLNSGNANTNLFGMLYVQGNLEIAGGTYRTITKDATKTGEEAPVYVKGNGTSYSDTVGHLLVSGGTLLNGQTGRFLHLDHYGQIDIAGGTVKLNHDANSQYLNALTKPARTIIRDGGLLDVSYLRVSQTTTGDGGEIYLLANGTARVHSMKLDYKYHPKGIVHFNGGKLQTTGGNSEVPAVDCPTSNQWDGVTFAVEAGGAIFDTSNGQHVWFGRPLVSGVAAGETDGGLTCLLGSERAVVLTDCFTNSTYNGPTRLEAIGEGTGSRTLQCRAADALPASTALQVGPLCQVGFNTWAGSAGSAEREAGVLAQTVARVEGTGKIIYNSLLTVTGAVAPVFDGAYGTLTFDKLMPQAALACDLEISGDANGCGCVKFQTGGQNISGLSLKVPDIGAFDSRNGNAFYKIVEAPNGFNGEFASADLPHNWRVKYANNGTAAYLVPVNPFLMVVR